MVVVVWKYCQYVAKFTYSTQFDQKLGEEANLRIKSTQIMKSLIWANFEKDSFRKYFLGKLKDKIDKIMIKIKNDGFHISFFLRKLRIGIS